jgi:hypothetical protein
MTVFRDLSQHILDIAENGVGAGATVLHINIEENSTTDILSIAIRDNGCGMDEHTLAQVTDPWFTTRTTRNVGLGIPFFKQTAEMCAGEFEIQSEPGKGTLTRAVFQRSHIDRPPLGDLTGTLLCMIVGFTDVDLVYQHRVDGQKFDFSTLEIREILGEDIPLSDPDVLAFLRGNFHEGLSELGLDLSGTGI